MGQTRSLFVYFGLILNTITIIAQNLTMNGKRVDGVLEI